MKRWHVTFKAFGRHVEANVLAPTRREAEEKVLAQNGFTLKSYEMKEPRS